MLQNAKVKNMASKIKSSSIIALILIFPIFLSGCAFLGGAKKFSPIEIKYPEFTQENKTAEKILQNTKDIEVKTIWSYLKINATSPKFKGKKFFYCTLLSEMPNKIRLRGNRIITSTLFEMLIVDDALTLLLNKDNIVYKGSVNDLKEPSDNMDVYNINPMEITRALLARNIIADNLRKAKSTFLPPLKNHYRLLAKRDDGGYEVFAVRKSDLLPEEIGVYNKDKEMYLRITFKQFARFKSELMPSKFVVELLESGIKADIEAQDYKINPPLQPQVFVIEPEDNTKILPLKKLLEKKADFIPE